MVQALVIIFNELFMGILYSMTVVIIISQIIKIATADIFMCSSKNFIIGKNQEISKC